MRLFTAFIFIFLISCNNLTNRPKHFTDIFKFKDKNGKENFFYGFKDADSARHRAMVEKKRILVLFSGYASMAKPGNEWRTLEVFGDNNKIQNNFILLWVPVDDKTVADDPEQTFFVNQKEITLKTVGERNLYWQTNLTKTNTQPVICVIDTVNKKYGGNLAYTKDEKEVSSFINTALDPKTVGHQIFYPPIPKINTIDSGDTL